MTSVTNLTAELENWELKSPFQFAGYTVTEIEVAHVVVERNGQRGQGEGIIPIVFDVTVDQMMGELHDVQAKVASGGDIEAACTAMVPGPARNALDCALWDLRAKNSGKSIWQLAGLPEGPASIVVDQTIGLGSPSEMAAAARGSLHNVLKIKADADAVIERLSAIRESRPDAELIVDANQAWSVSDLQRLAPALADLGVAMIEQPLQRGEDAGLKGLGLPVPIYADESCHTRADLEDLMGLYQGINIKLDKTGGLTEALALARAAKDAGLGVMVGCMSGTSLSMAPAFVIGTLCRWSDLDGPLLLASDRSAPMTYQKGTLSTFSPALWG